MIAPLAFVYYYEPWWIQIIKSLIIFVVVFGVMPILIVYERKLLGPLPEPVRPEPGRPVRPAAAARRDRQVRHQGARFALKPPSASCSGSLR